MILVREMITIGFDNRLLFLSPRMIRRAMKYSAFKNDYIYANVSLKFMFRYALIFLVFPFLSCSSSSEESTSTESPTDTTSVVDDTLVVEEADYCNEEVTVGAGRFDQYLNLLEGKRVALVGNQSSMVGDKHLVDTLLDQGVNVVKVFSPEHGFRGKADAGEEVNNETDSKTGLPIVSLYRKDKAPRENELTDVDVILFDIQDVGARFYTYISTMSYVMEAAAKYGKEMIVLDRPNPNGHYVAGPVLQSNTKSFVGMHSVPVVHGMTIGEYAKMVDGEGWMSAQLKDRLTVITCQGWDHMKFYEVPIAPSPNLPNMTSIYLYPGLCWFEGTVVSIGRGTDIPFQCVGHPKFEVDVLEDLHSFTPEPNEGSSKPKLEGETCHGYDFSSLSLEELRDFRFNIRYFLEFYEKLGMGSSFFLSSGFIHNLVGRRDFKDQVIAGKSQEEIEMSWQEDLETFKSIRFNYLLYPDFE